MFHIFTTGKLLSSAPIRTTPARGDTQLSRDKKRKTGTDNPSEDPPLWEAGKPEGVAVWGLPFPCAG